MKGATGIGKRSLRCWETDLGTGTEPTREEDGGKRKKGKKGRDVDGGDQV